MLCSLLNAYVRKEEMSLTNDLNFHLKKPEEEGHMKHRLNKGDEIIKNRMENNAIFFKKTEKQERKSVKPKDNSLRR